VLRSIVKAAIRWPFVTRAAGSRAVSRMTMAGRTAVFLYHEVSPAPSEFHAQFNLNVPPSLFEKQVAFIARNFNVITPEQLLSGNYDTPAALVTFDDGARGIFEHALPILRRHGLPAVIFLNMGPVKGEIFWSGLIAYLCTYRPDFVSFLDGRRESDSRDLPLYLHATPRLLEEYLASVDRDAIQAAARRYYGPFAGPADLSAASQSPLVYFANHLFNHYNCARLTPDELREAYTRNQAELDRYGNAVRIFSYPFGQPGSCFNDETSAMIRQLGTKRIFTAFPRIERLGREALVHRVAPTGDLPTEDAFMSWLNFTLLRQPSRSAGAS
jgi:peptidoglycan/xylan/chitin deacetylase (PgdA/CDA1 family)